MIFTRLFIIIFISALAISCQNLLSFLDTGGVEYKVRVASKDKNIDDISKQAIEVFENRFDAFGIKNKTVIKVNPQKPDEITIKVFGESDSDLVKKVLLTESNLALMEVVSPPNPNLATFPTSEEALKTIGGKETADRKVYEYTERDDGVNSGQNKAQQWIVVKNPPIILGNDLRNAQAISYGGNTGHYQISFQLKPEGAKNFGEWTGKNIGNYLAVVLNDEAKSVAFIQSQIFDQGQITGRFTKQEAEDLALILKSGYLPAKLELLEQKRFD